MKEIKDLLTKNGNYEFNVNEWGSCQYSGALAMYKAYFKLREKYDIHRDGPYFINNERFKLTEKRKTNKSILDYFREEFNYDISFLSIRDDENAIDMYFKIQAERWGCSFGINDAYENPEYEKLKDFHKSIIKSIRRAESGDDLFFVGRFAASDLWHTALNVAKSYFVGFEAKNLPKCGNPTGLERGPVGNICAQSDNVLTGLCCALLADYGIVKNTNSFKGFDT